MAWTLLHSSTVKKKGCCFRSKSSVHCSVIFFFLSFLTLFLLSRLFQPGLLGSHKIKHSFLITKFTLCYFEACLSQMVPLWRLVIDLNSQIIKKDHACPFFSVHWYGNWSCIKHCSTVWLNTFIAGLCTCWGCLICPVMSIDIRTTVVFLLIIDCSPQKPCENV